MEIYWFTIKFVQYQTFEGIYFILNWIPIVGLHKNVFIARQIARAQHLFWSFSIDNCKVLKLVTWILSDQIVPKWYNVECPVHFSSWKDRARHILCIYSIPKSSDGVNHHLSVMMFFFSWATRLWNCSFALFSLPLAFCLPFSLISHGYQCHFLPAWLSIRPTVHPSICLSVILCAVN